MLVSLTARTRSGEEAATAAIALILCLAGQASDGEEAVARVVLSDQLDREDALERHRGQPVVAMVVEAGRLRQLRSWEIALRERVPEVDLFRVADVPTGRGITRERVLERLDGRVPEEVSLLIDMEGRFARELGLDTSQPNLLLFDSELRITHRFLGRQTEAMVERVAAALAELGVGNGASP